MSTHHFFETIEVGQYRMIKEDMSLFFFFNNTCKNDFDAKEQDCSNSSALAME